MISITLSVNEWNIVMNALGRQPYLEVADLIKAMREQASTQLNKETGQDQ